MPSLYAIARVSAAAEVRLERVMVTACGSDGSNHVPVASGLVDSRNGKHAAIDLVHRTRWAVYVDEPLLPPDRVAHLPNAACGMPAVVALRPPDVHPLGVG